MAALTIARLTDFMGAGVSLLLGIILGLPSLGLEVESAWCIPLARPASRIRLRCNALVAGTLAALTRPPSGCPA